MNQVPWLRSGAGETPADGGCIMQVIDWIHTGGWTDQPECVHPVIRHLAIQVNDRLDDRGRQRLLDLAPRMMGTNTGDDRLTRMLLGYLARKMFPLYEEWAAGNPELEAHAANVLACIEAAERGEAAEAAGAAEAAEAAWAAGAAWAAWAAWAARAARAAGAAGAAWADIFALLAGVLDRYDEITGRTSVPDLDYSGVCEVMSS